MEEDNLNIQLVKLGEHVKYLEKKVDTCEQDIKTLNRENAKQSEEIRDATYLADSVNNRLIDFCKGCSEHKKGQSEIYKDLIDRVDNLDKSINDLSVKKLIIFVQSVVGTIFAILTIIAVMQGWIKFGG